MGEWGSGEGGSPPGFLRKASCGRDCCNLLLPGHEAETQGLAACFLASIFWLLAAAGGLPPAAGGASRRGGGGARYGLGDDRPGRP